MECIASACVFNFTLIGIYKEWLRGMVSSFIHLNILVCTTVLVFSRMDGFSMIPTQLVTYSMFHYKFIHIFTPKQA